MGTQVEVVCSECGKVFQRRKAEVRRSEKMGRKSFCSQSCSGTSSGKSRVYTEKQKIEMVKRLSPGNRLDEYSPFRHFMKVIRNRVREKGRINTLGVEQLKEQWEWQEGMCPYTGLKLELPTDSEGFHDRADIHNASVDRIDSSKGYVEDNIQFVSCMANFAKNKFHHGDMVKFCQAIAKHWS